MNNKNIFHRVKSYFLIALFLKVIFSGLGLWLNDPWVLGCILPLSIMIAYWIVGDVVRKKWDATLSLTKFADSIYYLGFLFTVVSIIICLLDINSIGDSLNNMAIRFGAAMVSTAIGMAARVIKTGFKVDANDAIKNMEDQLINSYEKLANSFDSAQHNLDTYRDKVTTASQEAVRGVQEQIEALYTICTSTMETYFINATQNSNDAFALIMEDARAVSNDMLVVIKNIAEKSTASTMKMDRDAAQFFEKTRERLENTIFPDDIFIKKLNPSIDLLSEKTDDASQNILSLADDVKVATRQVGTAIRGIGTKAAQLDANLTAASDIAIAQEKLIETLGLQNHTIMARIELQQNKVIETFDVQRQHAAETLNDYQQMTARLINNVTALTTHIENSSQTQVLQNGLADIKYAINESQTRAAHLLSEALGDTLRPLIEQLAVMSREPQRQHDNPVVSGLFSANGNSLHQTLTMDNGAVAAPVQTVVSDQPAHITPFSIHSEHDKEMRNL